jgi:hypothetical protein
MTYLALLCGAIDQDINVTDIIYRINGVQEAGTSLTSVGKMQGNCNFVPSLTI